jgi:hypothetical protein
VIQVVNAINRVGFIFLVYYMTIFDIVGKGCGNEGCKCENCKCTPGSCKCGK